MFDTIFYSKTTDCILSKETKMSSRFKIILYQDPQEYVYVADAVSPVPAGFPPSKYLVLYRSWQAGVKVSVFFSLELDEVSCLRTAVPGNDRVRYLEGNYKRKI